MSNESFLQSITKALFSSNISSLDSKIAQKDDPIKHASNTSSSPEPQVKCYLGISSGRRNVPYKIDDLLSGKMDEVFKSKGKDETTPSPLFICHYKVFSAVNDTSRREAATQTGLRVCGKKTTYILELGYTPEDVKAFAARGEFSKTIIRAYNAEQFSEVILQHTKKKLSEIETYNGKLLCDRIPEREPSPPLQKM